MKRLIAVLGLLAMATHGHAHEVRSTVQTGAVTIVSLTYANGKPFAFEQFEVMPAGAQTPSQVGRTDAQGRAAILPVAGKALEFTASAKDGHGARLALADKTAPHQRRRQPKPRAGCCWPPAAESFSACLA